MSHTKRSQRTGSGLGRTAAVLLLLVVCLPLAGRTPAAHAAVGDRRNNAQPALLQLAAAHPTANVSVIVQGVGTDGNLTRLITQLGGHITKHLSIIHAVAATLPARAVHTLATAPDVRWVSLDAPVVQSGYSCCNASTLAQVYPQAVGATQLWNQNLQGQGIGVAVIDSGIQDKSHDLATADGKTSRVLATVATNKSLSLKNDQYGHGSHVAGIIGGDGFNSTGQYMGIAPQVNLLNVKVDDNMGSATASDVVSGLQWVLQNKATYNIRVVNLSLNNAVADSYMTDPIDAAAEILWFNGIVVVVSAGNKGADALYAPANDPFVITVGAVDDQGTVSTADDTLASFSSYGTTSDGFAKPDLVAPGVNIISVEASGGATMVKAHQDHQLSGGLAGFYFRMSGTSMAAPVVAGAAALLLQAQPGLNPDQVKYRLMATASKLSSSTGTGAGEVNAAAAVVGTSMATANTGVRASQLLWTGSQPVTWGSVNWTSVNWTSVNWTSVNWTSVNWTSVNWNSDYWG